MDIKLTYMSVKQIKQYINRSKKIYARAMYTEGEYDDFSTALNAASREIDLTYAGRNHSRHLAFHITSLKQNIVIGQLVCTLSYENNQPDAFLDYIYIEKQHQRLGYASQAMKLLEQLLIQQDVSGIKLCVLSHKIPAQMLYKKLGYQITSTRSAGKAEHHSRLDMQKSLLRRKQLSTCLNGRL